MPVVHGSIGRYGWVGSNGLLALSVKQDGRGFEA